MKMHQSLVSGVLSLILISASQPVRANVLTTPLPVLGGKAAKSFATVLGVTKSGALGTLFFCNSTDAKNPVTLRIEVFDQSGALRNVTANDGTFTLQPGESVTAVLLNDFPAFGDTQNIAIGDPAINQGAARIVATSPKFACSALIADTTANPPASMATLSVITKNKQRGD